ncbi:MAG: M64 family metallopeptidase [Saprospiraceae bacterium]
MKNIVLIFMVLLPFIGNSQFDTLFENYSLRLDYVHSGNSESENFSFHEFKKEPYWGGSKVNLIDTFEYGKYFVEVTDTKTGDLIYSRGYGSLFNEWSQTEEAKSISKDFEETVTMPFPKNKIKISLFVRNKNMEFEPKFSIDFDPQETKFTDKSTVTMYPKALLYNGSPDKKLDIVVLAEGYSRDEYAAFQEDCQMLIDRMFYYEPYLDLRKYFNVHIIWVSSEERGSDDPNNKKMVNTVFNTSFNTLNSDRYCMTESYWKVRDYAANAPYDQIYILVNTDKYGGGAIYNYYSVSVSGNLKSPKVFIHEFGHAMAGLADEYAYEDSFENMYPANVEPWEPNITTLVDFQSKWKDMVKDTTPVPTPDVIDNYNLIGAFEGAGYLTKGVYRPMHDCLMRSFDGDVFCPVCTKAIEDMVGFYIK